MAVVRAGWMMWAEMRRDERSGPRVFQEMKNLAASYRHEHILCLSVQELVPELDKLGPWLEGRDVTFGIAGGESGNACRFSADSCFGGSDQIGGVY